MGDHASSCNASLCRGSSQFTFKCSRGGKIPAEFTRFGGPLIQESNHEANMHAYLPSTPSTQGCKSTWYSLTGNFKSPPRWFCLQNNKTLPRGSSDRTT